MYDFGSRLQALRKERLLTQKQLAKRINKSTAAISSYETNSQIPPMDVMDSIATVLNVSLDYLAGREPDDVYSFRSLSSEQRELLDLLQLEFCAPTNKDNCLSPQQIVIVQKLLQLFSSNIDSATMK